MTCIEPSKIEPFEFKPVINCAKNIISLVKLDRLIEVMGGFWNG